MPTDSQFASFVLECVLCATDRIHGTRLRLLSPLVLSGLKDIVADANEDSILRLFPLRSSLANFEDRLRPVQQELRKLEEDLEHASLTTHFHSNGGILFGGGGGGAAVAHHLAAVRTPALRAGRASCSSGGVLGRATRSGRASLLAVPPPPQQESPSTIKQLEQLHQHLHSTLMGPVETAPSQSSRGMIPHGGVVADRGDRQTRRPRSADSSRSASRGRAFAGVASRSPDGGAQLPPVYITPPAAPTTTTTVDYHDHGVMVDHHDHHSVLEATTAGPPTTTTQLFAFHGLETLAHHYSVKCAERLSDLEELKRSIEETAKFLEAAMDARRNQLLKMEVSLDVMALIFAFGALISGIFGMNLTSGLENSQPAFGWVVCCIMLVGLTIATSAWLYFRKNEKNQVYARLCEKFGERVQEYSAFSLCAANARCWGSQATGLDHGRAGGWSAGKMLLEAGGVSGGSGGDRPHRDSDVGGGKAGVDEWIVRGGSFVGVPGAPPARKEDSRCGRGRDPDHISGSSAPSSCSGPRSYLPGGGNRRCGGVEPNFDAVRKRRVLATTSADADNTRGGPSKYPAKPKSFAGYLEGQIRGRGPPPPQHDNLQQGEGQGAIRVGPPPPSLRPASKTVTLGCSRSSVSTTPPSTGAPSEIDSSSGLSSNYNPAGATDHSLYDRLSVTSML